MKTKELNKGRIIRLKEIYNFSSYAAIGRVAINYSLQLNQKFDITHYNELDSNGQEIKDDTLFGTWNNMSNTGIYRALINQHYERSIPEDEFLKLIKIHLDDGIERLYNVAGDSKKGRNSHIDFLLSIINDGLSLITTTVESSNFTSIQKKEIGAYTGLLEVEIGRNIKSNEPVKIRINDENKFDSQHFAVAGMNGSGKTELIKDILFQISSQTNHQLKFIFFDYKGEGKSEKLTPFLRETQCEFVNIEEKPFAFNPLIYIDLINERQRLYNIKLFKDAIASIDKRIGTKQKNSLEKVLKICFQESTKSGRHPSLKAVNDELKNYYAEAKMKDDTLTSILEDLADGIFADEYDPNFKLNEKSLYINLPPTLPSTVRQAAVFLMLNYLFSEYISSNDVRISNDRIKPIRYIIVIDEAHVYLKQKNMTETLENLLRMVRSKGVIIMLISQGIEEYKQKDFDFSSQVKIPILLNVKNTDLKIVKPFLGSGKSDVPLKKALKGLKNLDDNQKGGVVNFSEPQLIDINMFWKRKL